MKTIEPTAQISHSGELIEASAHHFTTDITVSSVRPNWLSSPAADQAGSDTPEEPIAIIGIGCRFPKAPSPEAFWRLMRDGVDAISEVPRDRWDIDALYDVDLSKPGKMSSRWGGFLDRIDEFDPSFFGISPREAKAMDPQQRLMLELSWEALEDAGIAPRALAGSRTGVFFGTIWDDYARWSGGNLHVIGQHSATGQELSIIPARVSYVLDLHGPSLGVNTACSSALVGVHLACHSLRRRESELALAGGVNIILAQEITVAMTKFGSLSPDGRSKSFDARANGYVRGEGGGVVVLKPLSLALAAGDPVYCVIRGSAVNNDGASDGLTAPCPKAQEQMLLEAYARAAVNPADVQYVEAHGPGTRVGDPIEAGALGAVLGAGRPSERPLRIGSCKTNIGHLEAAAGIAGLIKVALAMRHAELPPSLHFEQPNPKIPFEELRLQVQRSVEPWPDGKDGQLLAGVSAFGFGGTNCHIVLEGTRPSRAPLVTPSAGSDAAQLLLLSAHRLDALRDRARDTASWLRDRSDIHLGDLCYTASVRRSHHEQRLAVVGRSHAELADAIEAFARGESPAGLSTGTAPTDGRAKGVVFVFPGQGSQWLNMGRSLLHKEPAFREAFEACDDAIRREAGFSVVDEVNANEARSQLDEIDVLQPTLFAVEVALASLWRSWGVVPDAVVGHSMGEVAAAHVASALSLTDAVKIICGRSRLLRKMRGKGAMALVELTLDQAQKAIARYEGRLSVAVCNGPSASVLAGDPEALEEMLARLEEERVFCRRVKADVASHCSQMDALREDLLSALAGLSPQAARVPMLSTVTDSRLHGQELDAAYWVENLRQPVLFSQVTQRLIDEGHTVFVEMSPHPILLPFIEENLRQRRQGGAAIASLRRQIDERQCLLAALGALYTRGYDVDWKKLYPEGGRVVSLPTYPWQRERYWIEMTGASRALAGAVETGHPLLGAGLPVAGTEAVFEATLSLTALPYLADHRIFDEVVMPGAAMLELAHAAAAAHSGPGRYQIHNLALQTPLLLPEKGARQVQVILGEVTAHGTVVTVYSRPSEARPDEPWEVHAKGHVQAVEGRGEPAPLDLGAVRDRCRTAVPVDQAYARLAEAEVGYGPAFQGMTELWHGDGEALSRVKLLDAEAEGAYAYGTHPALLDAALQTLVSAMKSEGDGTYMAFEFGHVVTWQPGATEAWVHARLDAAGDADAEVRSGSLMVVDETGHVLIELSSFRLKRATAAALRRAKTATERAMLYRLAWHEKPFVTSEVAPSGSWLLLGDDATLLSALAGILRAVGARCTTAVLGESTEGPTRDALTLDPRAPAGFDPAFDAASEESQPLRGVVCLWGRKRGHQQDASPAELAERLAASALHLVQALVGRSAEAPRLWWVTQGAQAVEAGDALSLAQAPLWGLGRVVMQEHPQLACKLLDLDPESDDAAGALYDELCHAEDESQVAWRRGKRRVARFVKAPPLGIEKSSAPVASDGTVMITGGLGALGLHVASWLWEEHRVSHLVLISRRAPEGERLRSVERLRSRGAHITVVQADVGDAEQVKALMASLPPELPLRGIIHTAGVLDEGVLLQQSAARLGTVFAPKARGAWNLHEATRGRPLDFFVLFSSAVSVLGVGGLGNYATANAFLNGLAIQRRAEGLPAHALSWGPWSEGGMDETLSPTQRTSLSRQGIEWLTPAQGTTLLGEALGRPEAELITMPVDLRVLQKNLGSAVPPIWRALVAPRPERARAPSASGWIERLAALAPPARAAEVEAAVRSDVMRVLSIPSGSEVNEARPLREMGLDSLMAVELRNALSARADKVLPTTLIFDYPTVRALTRYLLDNVLFVKATTAVAPSPARPSTPSDEPIAIIGIGCRFPGGVNDVDSFWQMLVGETDVIREVPRERWDIDAYYDPDPDAPGKMVTRWGGFLDGVDQFDPTFFGIAPREAEKMDPQHRLLLETSWEALESAGLVPERLMDGDTGVFVGLTYHEYATLNGGSLKRLDGHVVVSNTGSVASGRISYLLGLKGPSLTVDTACSSSLVTLHLACQSLRSGECSTALAGGVALMLTPTIPVEFSRLRGSSPDGRCKSFDASADGPGWSEGCGMVVLKRLSDAQKDRDPVLAVIRGSAVNQDGRSNGLTAPNGPSQEAVIRRALKQAGVEPSSVDYVEAHGTGTPLGDPIEVQALGTALAEGRSKDNPVVIGTVKSNLGHTHAAAGVAGVIKTVLSMQHGLIPRSLHFTEPNPHVAWSTLPVKVAALAMPWPAKEKLRIAGVSSFGISGTNAHLVLAEAPRAPEEERAVIDARSHLLPLSAKSPEALAALAEAYTEQLGSTEDGARLYDVVYTASVRRSHHAHRLVVVGRSREELAGGLQAFWRGESRTGLSVGKVVSDERVKVAFVFPGQGSQWVGMGRTLLDEEPVFREALEMCDARLKPYTGLSLVEEMQRPEESSRLGETSVAQPVLFAIEVALAELFKSWGVVPDAVIGHSVGEVAAAVVAGVLEIGDAARIVALRASIMGKTASQGKMVAVALREEDARRAIEGIEERVGIAAINAPRSVVLAGEVAALDAAVERLSAQGVQCRPLLVNYAFHSPQMEPLQREFVEALGPIAPRRATIPMYSTVTGEEVFGEDLDAAYWASNIRKTVRFEQAMSRALTGGSRLFVEIGPHPVLTVNMEQCLSAEQQEGYAFPTLRKQEDARQSLLATLGALYVRGRGVDWKSLYPKAGRVVRLPAYPWQRRRYWLDTAGAGWADAGAEQTGHPLLGARLPVAGTQAVFEAAVSAVALPYLSDHRVFDEIVVPGAALVELVHAAATAHSGSGRYRIKNLTLQAPLRLPEKAARRVQVILAETTDEGTGVTLYSRSSETNAEGAWTVHAQGFVQAIEDEEAPAPLDLGALRSRCSAAISMEDAYVKFARAGVALGPAFQGVTQLWRGKGEALSRIKLPAAAGESAHAYGMHPALLDAALQTLVELLETEENGYLPFEFGDVAVWRSGFTEAWVHVRIADAAEPGAEVRSGAVTVVDERGQVLIELSSFRVKRASAAALRRAGTETEPTLLYRLAWEGKPLCKEAVTPSGSWLLVGQDAAILSALAGRLRAAGARCATAVLGEHIEHGTEDGLTLDPRSPEAYDPLFAAASFESQPLRGVLCVWGGRGEDQNDLAPVAPAERIAVSALHLVQSLSRCSAEPPRLWWVTEGAQALEPGAATSLWQAPLWGLGRVVMQEQPELQCTLLDLDPEGEDAVEVLFQELCHADDETQVAWRRGERRVARLVKAPAVRDDRATRPIASNGTVLITGGLGALGLRVAWWLWEEHRVRHLLLVGRRAPTGERLASVERLRAQGAHVTVVEADVADAGQVTALVESISPDLPLLGVIHAAGALEDAVLANQTAARFKTVFAPKALGAWNLHEATRDRPLDFFVLFSSMASLLGSEGQGNYAAANAFLDALAHRRRAEGLPGHSVNWGAWAEDGMAETLSAALRARFSRMGLGAVTPEQGTMLLGRVLLRPEAELAVMALDIRVLQRALGGDVPPIWRALVAPQGERARARSQGMQAERLMALDPAARAAEIELAVRSDVAKVLSMPSANDVPEERPLQELGLDSLMAVELRNHLSARVGKPLPATVVFDYPTARALTRYLLDEVLLVGSSKVQAVSPAPRSAPREEPIAVIGVGCRFPGGVHDPESFWRLLVNGIDAIDEVPRDRWDIDAYYDPNPRVPGKMVTRSGGFLDNVDQFDPTFFGIAPREAERIDPQQRLLLETSFEALESAGLVPERLMDSDTGVFVGLGFHHEYATLNGGVLGQLDGYAATGSAGSVASGRISYLFGFKGPSLTVDTACSSSLVAVHLACQSLRSGECSAALAGGVTLMLTPTLTVEFSQMGVVSPDGRSKSFDASADGAAWSEGAGVVVLKRLSDAERDGDPILALIRGSAVNQDGRSNGLTAPNGPSQEAVIRRALEQAGVQPASVDYVEAHGTGTALGDPIEVQALGAVLGGGRPEDAPLLIGSVKSNFGHTQAAAGVAGLIKTVLSMQHGLIPRSIHFTEPNPHIPWSQLKVSVAAETTPWPANGKPRIAGVSAFGISGTNAHVVLEAAPRVPEAGQVTRDARRYLLPLSARSAEALTALAKACAEQLGSNEDSARLYDIVYTASVRRSHLTHRLAVVGGSREELCKEIEAFVRNEPRAGASGRVGAPASRVPSTGKVLPARRMKLVFAFPGQGSQWVGMGRMLLDEEPIFRDALQMCDAHLKPHTGFSVLAELQRPEESTRLGETSVAQPALFAIEVALAELFKSWGVVPDAVIGHSVGEIAAAFVAGILDMDQAARLCASRGRIMQEATGGGKMVAVALREEDARRAIEGLEERIGIAAVNDAVSVVLAGEVAALDAVVSRLVAQGVQCRPLRVNYAFHSPQMEPFKRELTLALGSMAPRRASIPMYSTVSGDEVSGEELDAAYWGDNIRRTVRFEQAVGRALMGGNNLFVEVGPHPVLTANLKQCLWAQEKECYAVPTLRKGEDERRSVLETLGELYVRGYGVDWKLLYPERGRVVRLPTYPWQRARYWIEAAAGQDDTAPLRRRPDDGKEDESPGRADLAPALLRLHNVAPAHRQQEIEQLLMRQLSAILRLDSSQLAPETPLSHLGVDSLMALDLCRQMEAALGLRVSIAEIWSHPQVDRLAAHLASRFDGAMAGLAQGQIAESLAELGVAAFAPAREPPQGVSPLPASDGQGGSPGRWIVTVRPVADAKARLFCFPFGGGGAPLYYGWPKDLPPSVEVCAIQPPGRFERLSEPPPASLGAMVDALLPELLALADRPFAMFGHCFGALVMYEVTRALRDRNLPLPFHLFVAAAWSPRRFLLADIAGRSKAHLVSFLRSFGLDRLEVFKNAEIGDEVLHAVTIDSDLCKGYRYTPSQPLDVPITIFAGNDDIAAPLNLMEGWREETTARFTKVPCAGHHYFVSAERASVLRVIRQEIRDHLAARELCSRPLDERPAEHDLWLHRPRPSPRAGRRLFCFPCAGGDASLFTAWPGALLEDVEVCAVELPGHGARAHEAPLARVDEIADFVVSAVLPLTDRPFAFFGHDLGALVMYEVARRLRRRGCRLPEHLLVSAAMAPHLHFFYPIHHFPTAEFVTVLRALELVRDDEEPPEPIWRADCAAMLGYACAPELPLEVPITVLAGEQDNFIPQGSLDPWREHTTGAFALRTFLADHSVLRDGALPLITLIRDTLAGL